MADDPFDGSSGAFPDGFPDDSGGDTLPRADGFELGTDGVAVIVAGYDGSESSRDALAWAAGAARRNGGRLVVAFVVQPVPAVSAATPVAYAAAAAQISQANDLDEDVAAELAGYDVGWEFVVAQGDPAVELERVADAVRADVVVVGRSMGVHMLAGSVPRRLLQRAHRPLLVVP